MTGNRRIGVQPARSIPEEVVPAVCELIGDPNPLHVDRRLCESMGFSNLVVPGSLTATILFAEIERRHGPCDDVAVRFKRWVVAEQDLFLEWQDRNDRLVLRGADGRALATGRVRQSSSPER